MLCWKRQEYGDKTWWPQGATYIEYLATPESIFGHRVMVDVELWLYILALAFLKQPLVPR